jgi:lysophospholipase L1-like esterase
MAGNVVAQTKVACVGDSITQNSGWCEDLGTLLGAEYSVGNYGLSGATLLKMGDHPYWDTTQYTQGHDFAPNIVVIMLGTNDSKPQNWTYKDQFTTDYAALIETYRALASAPEIYICRPPPAGTNGFGISGTVIETEMLPLVDGLAVSENTGLIDIFTAFGGHDFDPALFGSPGDQVHPNGAGAQVIADTVYAALTAPPMMDAGAGGAGGEGGASTAGTSGAGGTSGGADGGGTSGGSTSLTAGSGGTAVGGAAGATSGSGGAAPAGSSGTSAAGAPAAAGQVGTAPTGATNSEGSGCGVARTQRTVAGFWFFALLIGGLLRRRRTM